MENLLIMSGIVGIILILYSAAIFFVARLQRNNSVMDIAYGPAFLVGTAGAVLITQTYNLLPLIVVACIFIWATRLGVRIFRKNLGEAEDARYAKWRKAWLKKGRWYFLIRSYLQVNLLQVIIILIVAAPAIWALAFPTQYNQYFVSIGFVVFAFGLTYETIADWQLDQFIKYKKTGKETSKLMTQGLFYYSRRPNYFGESLVWWGLAVMVMPLPLGWLALVSPILITYILTKVTGPILEDNFLESYPKEYRRYMDTTSYLIPWWPKQ